MFGRTINIGNLPLIFYQHSHRNFSQPGAFLMMLALFMLLAFFMVSHFLCPAEPTDFNRVVFPQGNTKLFIWSSCTPIPFPWFHLTMSIKIS